MRRLVATILLILLSSTTLRAAQDAMSPSDHANPQRPGPIAVPEPSPMAVQFYETGNILWFVNRFWALLVPAAVVASGASARLRDLARGIGRKGPGIVAVFVVLYFVLTSLVGLPLDYYEGFVRLHAYGLSNKSLDRWAMDACKTLGVEIGLAVLVLVVVYGLIAWSPRRWWLWTGLLTIPFLLTLAMVKPIWIDPLFNDFGPMKDKSLESKILALAQRAGIEGSRVFEVDKSRDTKTVNAYVTGFLDTKRIVLWDTIIDRLDEDELMVVMGHEMGHFVLGHVVRGIVFTSVLILIGLYGVHRASGWLIERFRDRFRFDRLSDVASLPLIILLGQTANLALTPVGFAYSRHMEHEADRFALELTRDNRAGAMAFVELQRENLGYPRPGLFYTLWRSTHPSLGDRIDFCNAYRPWETGQPLRYASRFREPRHGEPFSTQTNIPQATLPRSPVSRGTRTASQTRGARPEGEQPEEHEPGRDR